MAHRDDAEAPLTVRETANLAGWFCGIWFVANWTLTVGLQYTSVASATILSSMSSQSSRDTVNLIRLTEIRFLYSRHRSYLSRRIAHSCQDNGRNNEVSPPAVELGDRHSPITASEVSSWSRLRIPQARRNLHPLPRSRVLCDAIALALLRSWGIHLPFSRRYSTRSMSRCSKFASVRSRG